MKNDKTLKVLQWTAFIVIGFYMWRANKLKAQALGGKSQFQFEIDAEKAVEAAFNTIRPLQEMNPMVKVGVQEFVKGFQKGRNNE
jgi:hypothetical protein